MSAPTRPSRSDRLEPRPDRHPDIVALIFGLLAIGLAGSVLWLAFTGSIDWRVVKVGAPVLLVVAGVVGLAMSRHRTP